LRRGKRAVSQSKVDFATSAKSPHCNPSQVAPAHAIAPARSSSWASLCSPWAELQYPSEKSRSKVASRPKNRRTRLPPLLHNVLTRVAFCARFVSTPTAAPSCLPWQASRPSVACLFGEFFYANSAHNTRPYGADTLATSCQHRLVLVCGLCYSVCIPFVPAIRQQLQVLKKK
jgi:hypothetical protein